VHLEIDTSPLLKQREQKIYRSLVGMALWVNTIGRRDIGFAVMRCAMFQAAPRENHLKAILQV